MTLNKSLMLASMIAIADMAADMPGYRFPYVRHCLRCGSEIKTSRTDPFCDDYCSKKYAERRSGASWVDKSKKQKPWKRKKNKKGFRR